MIKSIRNSYNSEFTVEKYEKFVKSLNDEFGINIEFRVSETPFFIDKDLKAKVNLAISNITSQIKSETFLSKIDKAVPENLKVPNEVPYADVLSLDFAICKDESGEFIPKLIELQGFASLYFYQVLLDQKFREFFNIPENCRSLFDGIDYDEYFKILNDVIIGGADPENVILLEIEPEKQKTFIDFLCTEKYIGIQSVCISDIVEQGNKLYYQKSGKLTPIERIYNRVIFDELLKRPDIKYDFKFQDDLDVRFVAHPNWFFKISKYALPFLSGVYVPETKFLHQVTEIPNDLENYILKPLFSFAGSGVKYDIILDELKAITDKENYILQKKVNYEPLIQTPDIPAKAELRILMVYFNGDYIPLNNLVRLSKGKMMGVDFNKDKSWVGSSIAYFET